MTNVPRFIDVFVEPNENAPEGSGLRFRTEEASARPVSRVFWDYRWCKVVGWASAAGGSPCPAQAIAVEDSSAGTAQLVFGGDWGVRLMPEDGAAPFGEPYLLVEPTAVE